MLTIKNGVVVPDKDTKKHPYDLAARSEETLPFDCSIMTTLFVVDKMDVVVCDGDNRWYREADKPVASGQPISALFA